MTRYIALILGCLLLAGGPALAQERAAETLAERLVRMFEEAELGENARFSALVVDAETGEWLVNVNPNTPMKPASLTKMFTVAAALDALEPNARFFTDLETYATVDERGTLQGDLIVRGGGDPGLGPRFLLEKDDPALVLRRWARQLRRDGIRAIAGNIVGDDSHFLNDRWGEGWYYNERAEWYMAEISALNFNDNCIDLTFVARRRPGREVHLASIAPDNDYYTIRNDVTVVAPGERAEGVRLFRQEADNAVFSRGSMERGSARTRWAAVEDPARWTAHSFRKVLEEEGIKVEGKAVSRHRPEGADEPTQREDHVLLRHYSAPLSDQAVIILANSQNLYAEAVARNAALAAGYEPSFQGATAHITAFAERERIARPGFALFDASGLSPLNRIPPRSTIEVLRYARDRAEHGALFRESLARPGERGSLRARLDALEGRLSAKTGSLGDTSTIAGYLVTEDGREYLISVMVDLVSRGGAQAFVDRAVVEIDESLRTK